MTEKDIAKQIENNVYGMEIDKQLYHIAKNDIIDFISQKISCDFDINLYLCNTLVEYQNYEGFFDFVVGNPPYTRVHNIDDRERLKELRFTKDGTTDLYLAFFEMGLQMLNPYTGKLCYITPRAWMFNNAGYNMRKYIVNNNLLTKVIDFKHKQVFNGYTTYTSITVLDNSRPYISSLVYEDETGEQTRLYDYIWLNNAFCFADSGKVRKFREIYELQFDGFCKVRNGYATLLDKFFVNNSEMPENDYMIDACKASTLKMYKCFFPYDKNGDIVDFSDIETRNEKLATFLKQNRGLLEKRSCEKKCMWYGFGRSQAINDTFVAKYAIPTIIKSKADIKIRFCDNGIGVFGGLYIKTDVKPECIKEILTSDDFFEYLSYIGSYKSGGYFSITSKQLEKYLNYRLLLDYLKKGISVFTTCFNFPEEIVIKEKNEDIYGTWYRCETLDGCDASFKLKDFGKEIFKTKEDLIKIKDMHERGARNFGK